MRFRVAHRHGSVDAQAAWRVADGQGAAVSREALADTKNAVSRRGSHVADVAAAVVLDGQRHVRGFIRGVLEPHADLGRPAVLGGVGQTLLHDAVEIDGDALLQLAQAPGRLQAEDRPGLRLRIEVIDELPQVGSRPTSSMLCERSRTSV